MNTESKKSPNVELPSNNSIYSRNLKISAFLDRFPEQIREKNIIPIYDKNFKGYAPKNPGYSWKKYQENKYPVRDLMRKKIDNYAVICGDPLQEGIYLIVMDLDNQSFLEYFKDEETLIIKTPNGGYHIYYFSNEPVDKKKRFLKLPIDIQGIGSYVLIPPSSYENGSYEVIKNHSIKTIENLLDYVTNRLPKNLRIIEKCRKCTTSQY